MADNNDPNSNAAFQTSSAQSNPFTGELKGEFSSDFGTNTNAVSQIFKSGGFASENKSRLIILGVAAVAILGFAFWYLSEPMEGGGEEAAEIAETDEESPTDAEATPAPSDKPAEDAAATPAPDAATAAPAPAPSGDFTLSSPPAEASQSYDETLGAAEFKWEGAADQIIFSRSPTMTPATKIVNVNGASTFLFEYPYPGTWYWQVKNAGGASEIRTFKIKASPRRSFPVSQPTPGGNLAGSGGVVSWQAAEKVARYAVELSPAGQSFANPSYRFGTSGTSVALEGVTPGSYDLRVGAFSEVAGRWEWQVIKGVTVQ